MRVRGPKIRQVCNLLRRRYSADSAEIIPGLTFWPSYFSLDEQKTLLAASLYKLDSLESRQTRRKRRDFQRSQLSTGMSDTNNNIVSLFAPDSLYEFQEVCPIFSTILSSFHCFKGTFWWSYTPLSGNAPICLANRQVFKPWACSKTLEFHLPRPFVQDPDTSFTFGITWQNPATYR